MSCMLKLGERDCLVRGAPGESRSFPPSGRTRCSSFRLRLERRCAPPAPPPGPSLAPVAPPSCSPLTPTLMLQVRLRLCVFFMGVSSIVSSVMAGGGDWALCGGCGSLCFSAELSLSFSRCVRLELLFLELFCVLARPPPLPEGRPVLGWLLLDAPEENPSSGSFRLKDSSPPLMPSASERENERERKLKKMSIELWGRERLSQKERKEERRGKEHKWKKRKGRKIV